MARSLADAHVDASGEDAPALSSGKVSTHGISGFKKRALWEF